MNTLAIDIGGTKFSIAAFENQRMIKRITRTTDREGGREWMLSQIEPVARDWMRSVSFGFGGPVNVETQSVASSAHMGGNWQQ
jgi:glucokinase